ncbi:MAG: hypothetical protein NDJ90_01240 [Oligoflexia bacterium]|nr:hypothetical protein [Oligoflexia bacterium]
MNFSKSMFQGDSLSWPGLVLGVLLAAAATATSHAAEATADADPKIAPVRVNRSFFERTLESELKVVAAHQAPAVLASRSQWVEYPTELPLPEPTEETGPVLADFRDFKACNELERPGDLKLCFNVMPDVSSVGLNAREMALEGLAALLPARCAEAAKDAKLVAASRDEDRFSVKFALEAQGCQAQVELTVRSL